MNSSKYLNTIDRLRELGLKGDIYLSKPASILELELLQAEAKTKLGLTLPASYLDLLQFSDGVQIENAFFDGSKVIVGNNLDIRVSKLTVGSILVLGHQGNVDAYLYDAQSAKYSVANFYSFQEIYFSFRSFDELIVHVLHEQIQ